MTPEDVRLAVAVEIAARRFYRIRFDPPCQRIADLAGRDDSVRGRGFGKRIEQQAGKVLSERMRYTLRPLGYMENFSYI